MHGRRIRAKFISSRLGPRSFGQTLQGRFCFFGALRLGRSLGRRLQPLLRRTSVHMFECLYGTMNAQALGGPIARLLKQLLDTAAHFHRGLFIERLPESEGGRRPLHPTRGQNRKSRQCAKLEKQGFCRGL